MSNCQTECDDAQYGDDHIFIKYAMEMLADGQSTYLMCSSFRERVKKKTKHTLVLCMDTILNLDTYF